jgi:hypothetical protein
MLEVEKLYQPGSTNYVKLRRCSLTRASFVDQDTPEPEVELLVVEHFLDSSTACGVVPHRY